MGLHELTQPESDTEAHQALAPWCQSECQSIRVAVEARRHPFDCRPISKTEIEEGRFWAKVNKNGPTPIARPELGPCWVWTAAKNKRGYGSFSVNGRLILVHRVSVILDGREILPGQVVDHLCLNTQCCNPRHLEPKSVLANNLAQARNQITFCKRGHELTPENLLPNRASRQCRQCHKIHVKRSRQKQLGFAGGVA